MGSIDEDTGRHDIARLVLLALDGAKGGLERNP